MLVSEDPRPPVAIRITRPYTTEDEFLEQELETLSRTSVTLLGAQPRPQGVVLRFELVLSSGHVLMRGEGRVVGFRPNAHQGLGGLTLRFTRLDSRSKSLVDRAAALRDRRRPSALPGAPLSTPAPAPVPPPPRSDPSPVPAPADSQPTLAQPSQPDPSPSPPTPLDLEATHAEAPTSKRSERPPPLVFPAAIITGTPPDREELLARLRNRAKALEPALVEQILKHRRQQA